MNEHQRFLLAIWTMTLIALAIAVGLVLSIMNEAHAHEATNAAGQPLGWSYPYSCCSLHDCRPAAAGEVRETADGYRLVTTGEVIPYQDKRVKESPDGLFHYCQQGGDFDKGRVLCLFAPGRAY